MKITCEYCGTLMEDTAPACPSCGAPNGHIPRAANGIPQTIEELKDYCAKQNLPLEQMRFFIGVDYREPKAFGIYKDPNSGRCIVYKNKSDGSRAIRYEGTDEAYAVNEMYQKLKSEVANQKMHQLAAHLPGVLQYPQGSHIWAIHYFESRNQLVPSAERYPPGPNVVSGFRDSVLQPHHKKHFPVPSS